MIRCLCCGEKSTGYGRDWFCDNCETLYVPFDPAKCVSQYGEEYKAEYLRREKSNTNGPLQFTRWKLVQSHVQKGKILDMGCGVGAFLKKTPPNFMSFGIEINGLEVEHCKGQKLSVSNSIPVEEFDAITFWDVLEHFPDLNFIHNLKETFLKPGGFIFITVPNFTRELLPTIIAWKHYKPNEHIHCFSEKSIDAFCDKFGFKYISKNYEESVVRGDHKSIASYVIQNLG